MFKKRIDGIKMWLEPGKPGISRRIIAKDGGEPCFMWILRHEASGVAFDVGANIGYTTLHLAQRCTEVVAFEPDPRNISILDKNVEINNGCPITVKRIAIGPRRGFTQFILAQKPNLSRMGVLGDSIGVEVESIDEQLAQPDFIKADLEGGEVGMLQGAMKTLRRRPVKILIEVHPQFYGPKNDMKRMLRSLFDIGYQIKYVVNAKGRKLVLKPYPLVKEFKDFPRAVYTGIPLGDVLPWICEMPADGKKVVQAILLEKL